jgi:hypothetical protein
MYCAPPDCAQPSAGTVQTAAETSAGGAPADDEPLATALPDAVLPETLALAPPEGGFWPWELLDEPEVNASASAVPASTAPTLATPTTISQVRLLRRRAGPLGGTGVMPPAVMPGGIP